MELQISFNPPAVLLELVSEGHSMPWVLKLKAVLIKTSEKDLKFSSKAKVFRLRSSRTWGLLLQGSQMTGKIYSLDCPWAWAI